MKCRQCESSYPPTTSSLFVCLIGLVACLFAVLIIEMIIRNADDASCLTLSPHHRWGKETCGVATDRWGLYICQPCLWLCFLVNCPTRLSFYSYLHFCVDHLQIYFTTPITEKYSTAMCFMYVFKYTLCIQALWSYSVAAPTELRRLQIYSKVNLSLNSTEKFTWGSPKIRKHVYFYSEGVGTYTKWHHQG